jgi:hypothetical protein
LINDFHITGIQNMHAHQNWDVELRVINIGVYQWKPDAERHRETSPSSGLILRNISTETHEIRS